MNSNIMERSYTDLMQQAANSAVHIAQQINATAADGSAQANTQALHKMKQLTTWATFQLDADIVVTCSPDLPGGLIRCTAVDVAGRRVYTKWE